MINVNELVGIIKGIGFDGVINEKEVNRLQKWTDKNRNLAYDSDQIKLIKLIQSVLEDSIITEKERVSILDYCHKLLRYDGEDNAKIYELNGIIDGIICDDVVNQEEVKQLGIWMDANGDSIRYHKPTEHLCIVIDRILEDGIVTKEEQTQLLDILKDRIHKLQFNNKLAYLRKLVKERENIGIDLIDLLDNEDDMNEIHMQAERQLNSALSSFSGVLSDSETVFISLVLIAMLYYDGSYYDSVRTTYTQLYKKYNRQKIESYIRTVLNKYRTQQERNTPNSRIINVVLSNAIVPSNFLKAFFEFIFDIYKLNFEYDLSDDLYEDFSFVYDGLKNSMLSEGDDIQINVTKKTYKLISTTKRLITNSDYIDSVIKLSIIVVKLIDKHIWNKDLKIFNPYLKRGYLEWVASLDDSNIRRGKKRTVSEFRSRWEPRYLLDNNEVYLIPPIHRIKSTYDYRKVYVEVLNQGKNSYSKLKPDIREIIGGFEINIPRIKIWEPLNQVEYRLLAGNEIIYSSKDKLYRKSIVFDTEGNEIKNNTDYSGTAIFCINPKENEFNNYYKCKNYALASKSIHKGDAFYIAGKIFNFSSMINPGIFGDKYDDCYLIDSNEVKIPVYSSIEYLVFEIDNPNALVEIVINGHMVRLKDCNYTENHSKGTCRYTVKLGEQWQMINSITVYSRFDNKRKKICAFRFAVDKRLEAECVLMGDYECVFSLRSDFVETQRTITMDLKSFDEKGIVIEIDKQKYHYCIPCHFELYRIDGGEWNAWSEPIWTGSINQQSTFEIYGNDIDGMVVLSCAGVPLENKVDLKFNGITQTIQAGFLASYKSYDFIIIIFLKNNRAYKPLFCYNKCVMDQKVTNAYYNTHAKKLEVVSKYFGEGKVFCKVTDKQGRELYRSKALKNYEELNVDGLLQGFKYHIVFFEKPKGLSLNKERVMYESDIFTNS